MSRQVRRGVPLVAALAILVAGVLAGCGGASGGATPTTGRPSVVASFYPIEYFARRVGGDSIDVYNPVPPGAEPHDLELSPRSIERIQKFNVLLYLGPGFQSAIDRTLSTLQSSGLKAFDVSAGITRLPPVNEAGQSQASTSSNSDPHIWLDPADAQKMVDNIAAGLTAAGKANEATYQGNAQKVKSELAALDAAYGSGLASCKRKEIVTSHAAFAYLAKRYGLTEVPIAGLSPETEPSPARLEQIAVFARQHDVKYIFTETLVEPKVAQAVAREAGAQLLVLNPVEGLTSQQVQNGNDYMSLMRDNLANLQKALSCAP